MAVSIVDKGSCQRNLYLNALVFEPFICIISWQSFLWKIPLWEIFVRKKYVVLNSVP
jgi:hypothetical protein